jgi:hypothetical protein
MYGKHLKEISTATWQFDRTEYVPYMRRWNKQKIPGNGDSDHDFNK